MITLEQLRAIMPQIRSGDVYVGMLNSFMGEFDINTPLRSASFLAQVAHESGQCNRVEENLNYSADALRAKFPSHFPDGTDMSYYHRQPERIANRLYANRMGNGPESSGDGWKHRGRGLIQLTGYDMYLAYEAATGVSATASPELLMFPRDAARSACWFWKTHGLNELADVDNFLRITKRINAGTNGEEQREKFYVAAKAVLL